MLRKSIMQRGGKVLWAVMFESDLINGYHTGTARTVAEADKKIANFVRSLNEEE